MMKKISMLILLIGLFSGSVSGQKAKLLDEFGRIPCGDFLLRINTIVDILRENPGHSLYIVYYGGRYRRERSWNPDTKRYDITKLEFAHRDDGLNWAKTVRLFFEEEKRYGEKGKEILKNMVLLNGGYREDIVLRIWLVPKGVDPPEPKPTFTEKDIKLKALKPIPIRRYSQCYSGYEK